MALHHQDWLFNFLLPSEVCFCKGGIFIGNRGLVLKPKSFRDASRRNEDELTSEQSKVFNAELDFGKPNSMTSLAAATAASESIVSNFFDQNKEAEGKSFFPALLGSDQKIPEKKWKERTMAENV